MSEYKSTLNLPNTAFPMKGNLANSEPQRLKNWIEQDIYGQIRQLRSGREQFILHDGPPYANGDLHLGHAVKKVLKDIVIKSQTLNGFDVPYKPGWDCHGLPIEHKVETKIGKAGLKVDHRTFRQKCREYAQSQVERQRETFIRMGVFGDWDNPYLTMNYQTEADIVRALGKIIAKGHLHKGEKPVYWSVVGGSALAEAEVEYQDKTSYSIDVAYPVLTAASRRQFVESFGQAAVEGELAVVIWTTTPWTLPSSQAVSLHPELEYVLVGVDGRKLVVARALLESFCNRCGIEVPEVLGSSLGANLENAALQHPFYDKQVPILLGEHVTTEAGTGCVHTAPDHGVDDYNVGRKYGIGILNYVDDGGLYRDNVELFAGEHVYKVDPKVLDVLQEHGNLLSQSQFEHSYPHCWRTKTPLIFRATPQWFISMTQADLLKKVKAEVENVQWIPNWGRARIDSMLDSSPDWCISRQRTWGVPICLFVQKESQELHPRTLEIIEEVAQLIEKEGMEAWFELDAARFLGEEADQYSKVTDTLDVWFDSGVTHYSVLMQEPELRFPADLYLEGSDQHRGWFQSSLKTSVAMNDCAPYKQVLTHGFTVDQHGRKMSKSVGNVIEPQKVMSTLGADVMRLWIAATDFSGEMSVSDEILKRTSDSYRRIRNTLRYMLSNLDGFTPEQAIPTDEMLALDRWALDATSRLQDDIIRHYNEYQFHLIYQKLHNFCVVEMGGFYLDIIKDRIYTCQVDSVARRSAQSAIHQIAQAFVRWIAPILSFTADEAWEHLPGAEGSIFTQEWLTTLPRLDASASFSEVDWDKIIAARDGISPVLEEFRREGAIRSSLEAELQIDAPDDLHQLFARLGDELRFVLMVSKAVLIDQPAGARDTGIAGLGVAIKKSGAEKCVRCWHFREDVGDHPEHPELCGRCIENVDGNGEVRQFA
ncbi:MAG: isoleucine--tRNA ligase [Gammaproteobacteria bacterium]